MMPWPHHYSVSLSNRTLQAPPRDAIAVGPPPQFDGDDRHWSPEELLVGAVLECLWTTFEAFARRANLAVHDFSGTAAGILDRGSPGSPVPGFTSIELKVQVTVDAGDVERARAVLDKAERNCIISHALNVPVKVTAIVNSGAAI